MKSIRLSISRSGLGVVLSLSVLFLAGTSGAQGTYTDSPYYYYNFTPVRITSPANYTTYYGTVDVPIFAVIDTFVVPKSTNVEFYAGTNDLGRGVDLGSADPRQPVWGPLIYQPNSFLSTEFSVVWTNPPPGTYDLRAVWTRAGGMMRTSAPVAVTIMASVNTGTNALDVVSVVASDPIAIAGTNSWTWLGGTNPVPSWTNWYPLHLFTNWGPRNATFTISRYGDASHDLNINYTLGGTASNGVNYAALSGQVTITAGGDSAVIPVVPIDNGPPFTNAYVTLTLAPSTNNPTDYTNGFPSTATALILEKWPRPLPFFPGGGFFHLNEPGADGAWFRIDASTDLVNWTTLCTNQVMQGSIDFVDPNGGNGSGIFYRAVPSGGP